jgi:hypothetical protein
LVAVAVAVVTTISQEALTLAPKQEMVVLVEEVLRHTLTKPWGAHQDRALRVRAPLGVLENTSRMVSMEQALVVVQEEIKTLTQFRVAGLATADQESFQILWVTPSTLLVEAVALATTKDSVLEMVGLAAELQEVAGDKKVSKAGSEAERAMEDLTQAQWQTTNLTTTVTEPWLVQIPEVVAEEQCTKVEAALVGRE